MSDKKTVVNGGIGFWSALGVVFITLKLCNVINWSWWLVLLPLYGPLAAFLSILFVIGLCVGGFCLVAWIIVSVFTVNGRR